jgi:hypothetical protein
MGEVDNDLHVLESIYEMMMEAEDTVSVGKDDRSYSDEFGTASVIYDELEYESVTFKINVPGTGEGAMKKIIANIVEHYDSENKPDWEPTIEYYKGDCYLGWEFKKSLA